MNNKDLPKAYLLGYVEFYKLKFKVTPDVLIPRPETELLVDLVLQIKPNSVLEVGTGAGNIAISIAKNLSRVKITATEISNKALKIAKGNTKFHQVEDRIEFINADLLNVIASTAKQSEEIATSPSAPRNDIARHEVIVANLPYIPSERILYLDSSVKDFEPHVALDGGKDGFSLYRKLFLQIIEKNLYPSYLIAEIDYTHGELAVDEASKYFPKCQAEVNLDLAHRQRILIITF